MTVYPFLLHRKCVFSIFYHLQAVTQHCVNKRCDAIKICGIENPVVTSNQNQCYKAGAVEWLFT